MKRNPHLAHLSDDPYLKPFQKQLDERSFHIGYMEKKLTDGKISLNDFANAHEYFGLHLVDDQWIFREWAPNATEIYLIGDFNNWNRKPEYALKRISASGVWEVTLDAKRIEHGDLYKLLMIWPSGYGERLPAYARRVVQDSETHVFSAQVWQPETQYVWKHKRPTQKITTPLIYESHVGMAQEAAHVSSYIDYKNNTLPRIIEAGYNTIQLMGIMEHPYYGSFGYHVSNFFAASSRFGTPEELKELIDAAHEAGIAVIMDLVHSHAVKNEAEGLSCFDGTHYQYFHEGARGDQVAWDSRCFDYGKPEVVHFLLSNARFWLDEYNFDGYRFDGVTSMLYHHRGLNTSFTSYDNYFDGSVDNDAFAYLALANKLIHEVNPDAMTIAEDVSGLPGLGASIEDGGCGFDFRLGMGIPDCWFKLVNDIADEDWNMSWLYHELTSRRQEEQSISYVESHDQALVGGKTFIFELIDAEMYYNMHRDSDHYVVNRGLALHKMARLATIGTAPQGYLNFMGNEFGHPEWIDFPREGNNWSYHHARRRWSLRDDPNLKYHFLADFDREMVKLVNKHTKGENGKPQRLLIKDDEKLLFFEHNGLYFFLNFNHANSYVDFPVEMPEGEYRLALNTDEERFGGHSLIESDQHYHTEAVEENGRMVHKIKIYTPSRTALVLEKV